MDTPKYESNWKLMNEYKFLVDPDSIHDDMLCIICNNLMVDACHSICGCQYCHKCIKEYIGDNMKYCPGNKLKCKEEFLCIDRDVLRDVRMNNKIFNAKVLCPNEECDFKSELSQMHEHLRVCSKQSMECPYATIGCDNGEQSKDAIINHLSREALPHTQLLMEYINYLKNEVNVGFETNKVEICSMREELKIKDIQIKAMAEQLTEQKREIAQHKIEIENMKTEYMNKNNIVEAQLRDLTNEMKGKVTMISKDTEKVKEESERQGREIENVRNYWQLQLLFLKEKIERPIINFRRLYLIIDADFVWRIDGVSVRDVHKRKYNYSGSFYSNNYKFCLFIHIRSDDNIWLSCVIMAGDNDDKVEWPMRLPVTLSIINQDTLATHKNQTIQFDTLTRERRDRFDRPKNDINIDGIGGIITKYSAMKIIPSIIVDNSIIVSCVIGDK